MEQPASDERDTGEVPAVEPRDPRDDALQLILIELHRIRYRLSVLVFFLVVLPIVVGVIALVLNND